MNRISRSPRTAPAWFGLLAAALVPLSLPAQWQLGAGPLKTPWTDQVSPQKVHPEYPRPQMVRSDWFSLNGLWDFALAPREAAQPAIFPRQILVPFPVESALSGVMRPVAETDQLWYRRYFEIPKGWVGRRVLLHFGAADFDTTVWLNGQNLGRHRGGYDGFSFDITDALRLSGTNELVVSVYDPTDAGTQPRGNQVRKPIGIWYTATSGIWQTVWIEPVEAAYIKDLKITPDFDAGTVTVRAFTPVLLGKYVVEVKVRERGGTAASGEVTPGGDVRLSLPHPRPWSPEDPFLYSLVVSLRLGNRTIDSVESYFGLRKISLGKDAKGFTRLCLNNRPYFMFGPLDQGFWPDGLYTAPTDEALRYDIEMTRKLGFNLARKHVKIEPDRWYYWCDRLGLLVWQDMPSGDKYINPDAPDIVRSPESAQEYADELEALIAGRRNHPSIVMWVPFNEGWGQFDTAAVVDRIHRLDPTRLVDNTSGWADRKVGDVCDLHSYPGPDSLNPEPERAAVLGEFGGLGLPLAGHTWQAEKNWGYRSFHNAEALTFAYLDLVAKLFPLVEQKGLSAAVYTQTTDVEVEVNGLMTYDRKVLKMDLRKVSAANRGHPLASFSPLPPPAK